MSSSFIFSLSSLFDNVLQEHDSFVGSLNDMTWDFLEPSSSDAGAIQNINTYHEGLHE